MDEKPPEPATVVPEEDRPAYDMMVLGVIGFFHPTCSDYQLWRGIIGKPLDLRFPRALYPTIERMVASGLITASKLEGYPHNVYGLTETGSALLESAKRQFGGQ